MVTCFDVIHPVPAQTAQSQSCTVKRLVRGEYSSEISNDGFPTVVLTLSRGGVPAGVGNDLTHVLAERLANYQVERVEVCRAEPELEGTGPGGGQAEQQTAGQQEQSRLGFYN